MENEKFLPCKSCGKPLSSSAGTCPQCGETSPFCFDVKFIERRGKNDAEQLNRIEKTTVVIAVVVPIVLYFLTRIWWLSIIALIALGVLGLFITGKKDDVLYNQFLVDIDSDYKSFKSLYHYDLTDDQYELWKSRVHSVYIDVVNKNTKNIYGKLLS